MNRMQKIGLVTNLQEKTMQNLQQTEDVHGTGFQGNYKIAKAFYDFLTGRDNRLPSIDFLAEQIKKIDNHTISVGCGLSFGIVDDKLHILLSEPIDEKSGPERFDVITAYDYQIYTLISNSITYYDPDKDDKYDKKRIKAIQELFSEYDRQYSIKYGFHRR